MKKIRFAPNVPAEVRSIEREAAFRILTALHRYAENGEGDVKSLMGEFEGMLRLRVGSYRVVFEEAEDTIHVLRVRDRRDVYR